MKSILIILTLIILVAFNNSLKAQEKNAMDTVEFQFGFISPIGTNGLNSWKTINRVSLNMYAGYAGGLEGFEASGFVSALKGNMNGVQFSGFVNANMGHSNGAQFAGFANYNKLSFEGAQFAGFVNVTTAKTNAFQAAGFVNTVVGDFEGAQLAGFVNATTKNAKGAQFAGFLNVVSDSIDGFQGAGFANFAMGNSMGQASGFFNANVGNMEGVQAAGFANINTGTVKGAQLSGFLNLTNRLNGIQLGVFNYVDSLESGTPIGIFSFVRNGYHSIELSASETMYGIASFKTGTKRFYNILSFGGATRNNEILWGWGYGIGTSMPLSGKLDFAVELQSFHINEGLSHTDHLNIWNKLTLDFSYQLSTHIEVFGAPTFNVVITDTENSTTENASISPAPFSSFSKTYPEGRKVEMYPGLNVGIRF